MATLEFSAGFISAGSDSRTAMIDSIAGGTINYSTSGLLAKGLGFETGYQPTNHSTSRLTLYSGTPPTQWIPTPYTTYNSNVLVAWTSYGGNFSASLGGLSVSNSIISVSTLYVPAAATGTATWLMLWSHRNDSTTGQNIPYQQIIGTVGLPGSGADLLIGDTDIVAGKNYRISNLQIQLPTSWTY